jgi:hypothetical protein
MADHRRFKGPQPLSQLIPQKRIRKKAVQDPFKASVDTEWVQCWPVPDTEQRPQGRNARIKAHKMAKRFGLTQPSID